MITICLIAVGLLLLAFLRALREAPEGYEDERGFHAVAQARPVAGLPVGSNPAAPGRSSRVFRASPWLRLPVHGQDEIDLIVARAVNRQAGIGGH